METAAAGKPFKFRLNSVAFLVATLLFLLPFVNIKCNDQKFASNTGVGLAFGTDYKTTSQLPYDITRRTTVTEKQSGEMYIAALVSLLLGVAGIILSVVRPGANKLNTILGILGALALVILMVQIISDVNVNVRKRSDPDDVSDLKVKAEFTVWYYLSLISFMAASFFSYRRKSITISG